MHCHAGVSRSTAAATLIMMQANPEWSASDALEAVAALRPRAWPNLLILELGEALLRRNGEIVAAVGAIYRRVLARDPEFGEQMIDAGRRREVSIALRETTGRILMSEDALIAAMARHPIIVERPIVVSGGKAALGHSGSPALRRPSATRSRCAK